MAGMMADCKEENDDNMMDYGNFEKDNDLRSDKQEDKKMSALSEKEDNETSTIDKQEDNKTLTNNKQEDNKTLAYSTHQSNKSDEDKIVEKNQHSFGKLTPPRHRMINKIAKSKVQILSITVESLDVIVSCRLDNGRGKNIDFKFDSYNDKVITITDKLIAVGLIAEDQCDDVESLLSDIVVRIGSISKADLQQLVGWTVPSKPSTPTTPTTTPTTTISSLTTTRAIFQIGGEEIPSTSTKSLNNAHLRSSGEAGDGGVDHSSSTSIAALDSQLSRSPKRVVSLDTGMSLDLESLERRLKRVLKRTPSGRIMQSSTERLGVFGRGGGGGGGSGAFGDSMSSTGQPGRSSLLEDGEYEGRGEVGLAEGGLAVGSSTSSLASDYWDFGDLPSFITKVSSTKKKEGRKSVKFASGAGASRGSKGGKMRILQRHVSDVSHDRPRVRLVQRSASFQKGRFQVFPVDEVDPKEEDEEGIEKKEQEEEEEEKMEMDAPINAKSKKKESKSREENGEEDGGSDNSNSRSSYDDEADDDGDDDDDDDDDIRDDDEDSDEDVVDVDEIRRRQEREIEALRARHEEEVKVLHHQKKLQQNSAPGAAAATAATAEGSGAATDGRAAKSKRGSSKRGKKALKKSLSTPAGNGDGASAAASGTNPGAAYRRRKPPQLQIPTEEEGSRLHDMPQLEDGTLLQKQTPSAAGEKFRRVSAGSAPASPNRTQMPHLHPPWMQNKEGDGGAAGAEAAAGVVGEEASEPSSPFSFMTTGGSMMRKRGSVDHQLQHQQQNGASKGRRYSTVLTDMMRAFTAGTRGKH